MPDRVFVIHVCPECGYYTADPILKRKGGISCFRCGQRAVDALDLSRVARSYHHWHKSHARDSAPTLVPTRVVPDG